VVSAPVGAAFLVVFFLGITRVFALKQDTKTIKNLVIGIMLAGVIALQELGLPLPFPGQVCLRCVPKNYYGDNPMPLPLHGRHACATPGRSD
jgi:hypothetical protein